jgi:hypothetical protein
MVEIKQKSMMADDFSEAVETDKVEGHLGSRAPWYLINSNGTFYKTW